LKQWVKKLLGQFEAKTDLDITEDRATLLFLIDAYSKHLLEIEGRSVRKVREIFDEFAKGLIKPDGPTTDKLLFRFRQFFAAYRIEEYTYLQKTFEDFKGIIWDFADQLNESVKTEQARDVVVRESLDQLREAVEANSIEELKSKSREFIDFYIELQTRTDEKRTERISTIQQNLANVKKKLVEVNQSARRDHLTGAYNRKFFDEISVSWLKATNEQSIPITAIALDIDYFKKINDIFGHDTGDFVLKELVRMLRELFKHEKDFIARLGGEEFLIVLPERNLTEALELAEKALGYIRSAVIVHSDTQIRFTVSMGLAELNPAETIEKWMKRADTALYEAKNSGRDKAVIAPASGSDEGRGRVA